MLCCHCSGYSLRHKCTGIQSSITWAFTSAIWTSRFWCLADLVWSVVTHYIKIFPDSDAWLISPIAHWSPTGATPFPWQCDAPITWPWPLLWPFNCLIRHSQTEWSRISTQDTCCELQDLIITSFYKIKEFCMLSSVILNCQVTNIVINSGYFSTV